jgi:hypothetical protein
MFPTGSDKEIHASSTVHDKEAASNSMMTSEMNHIDSTSLEQLTDEEEDEVYFDDGKPYHIQNNYSVVNGAFKLVLIVNNELKMTKGIVAAVYT